MNAKNRTSEARRTTISGAARAAGMLLLLACSTALAGEPAAPNSLTIDALTELWARAYVTVTRAQNGDLKIVDCPSAFELRLGPAFYSVTPALREVSPYLLADLGAEIYALAASPPGNEAARFRALVAGKVWSEDARVRLIRAAAGYNTLSSTDPGTGRCDGSTVGCAPPAVCGCETVLRDDAGQITGCAPPRETCNTVNVPGFAPVGLAPSGRSSLSLITR